MNNQTVDVLAFGAHPDDVEACAGGLVSLLSDKGLNVGKIDLTSGDLSNTGNGNIREQEALEASRIMGMSFVDNLGLPDRELDQHPEFVDKLIEKIRTYKPKYLIAPIWDDKHIDHVATSHLVTRAASGAKYEKVLPHLEPHKVEAIYYYIIHHEVEPSFILDISKFHDRKMKALFSHKSQMFLKDSSGKQTDQLIDKGFIEYWEARSRVWGYQIGAEWGEAYVIKGTVGVTDPTNLKVKILL